LIAILFLLSVLNTVYFKTGHMIQCLLDVVPDLTFGEKLKSHSTLIIISLVALAGLIIYFVWRNKKGKQNK